MTDPRTAKLVRQHAETSRLLGVDFVPTFRRPGAEPIQMQAPAPVEVSADTTEAMSRPASPPADAEHHTDPRRAEAQRRLDELRQRYEREAPHRKFVTAFTNIVFGEGDPCAQLMFIGEAPGADEDRTGRPFVGRAGQLLEKMINAMGLQRQQVYITNILKTRPPNNATPTRDETILCAPYLFEQIAIIRPEVIVTLGVPATHSLLATDDSMTRLRGRWAEFPSPNLPREICPSKEAIPGPIAVMPTYHPAFLLRSYTRENRAKVWSDLQKVMERLGLAAPEAGARAGFAES